MGGWVDGHFDIFFDILLKPPQPFTGIFLKDSIWTTREDNGLDGVKIFLMYRGGTTFFNTIHQEYTPTPASACIDGETEDEFGKSTLDSGDTEGDMQKSTLDSNSGLGSTGTKPTTHHRK